MCSYYGEMRPSTHLITLNKGTKSVFILWWDETKQTSHYLKQGHEECVHIMKRWDQAHISLPYTRAWRVCSYYGEMRPSTHLIALNKGMRECVHIMKRWDQAHISLPYTRARIVCSYYGEMRPSRHLITLHKGTKSVFILWRDETKQGHEECVHIMVRWDQAHISYYLKQGHEVVCSYYEEMRHA